VSCVRAARRVLAAVLLATVVGCSGPIAADEPFRTIRVRIHFSRFEPSRIVVSAGETIRFVVRNTDPIAHEFIVGNEAVQRIHEEGTEAHDPVRPGEMSVSAGSTRQTVYTFGSYDLLFGCHLPGHYAYGMRGSITVA
jgi:uncharacterized cupredoxin-like copper-binding protein